VTSDTGRARKKTFPRGEEERRVDVNRGIDGIREIPTLDSRIWQRERERERDKEEIERRRVAGGKEILLRSLPPHPFAAIQVTERRLRSKNHGREKSVTCRRIAPSTSNNFRSVSLRRRASRVSFVVGFTAGHPASVTFDWLCDHLRARCAQGLLPAIDSIVSLSARVTESRVFQSPMINPLNTDAALDPWGIPAFAQNSRTRFPTIPFVSAVNFIAAR